MPRQTLRQIEEYPVKGIPQRGLALAPELRLLQQHGVELAVLRRFQLPVGQHAQAGFNTPGMLVPGLPVQGCTGPALLRSQVQVEMQAQGVLRAHVHQQDFLAQLMQRVPQGRQSRTGPYATANAT